MNKKISLLTLALVLMGFLALNATIAQAALTNPLGDTNMTVGDLFLRIVKAFIGIIGGVATVYFIYGGLLMMTSAGNAEQVQKGKNAIVYAVLGMVITFTSWQIMMFVIEALESANP